MPIKIEWIDPNGENADVKVYRSTSPIAEGSLPAPLATVVGGAGVYVDAAVARNQLYYYRLSSPGKAGSGETIITPNKPMAYMPYTGPGPQTLKRGDWECGYFGRMPIGELIAQSDMINFAGFPATVVENPATDNEWLKFVYKGKIFFTPKWPLCSTIAWDVVYKAGLVYGNIPEAEWTAYAKTTWGVVPQNKQIAVGDHTFIIRNPTSRGNPLNTGTTNPDYMGGEIDQFLALVGRSRVYPDANNRGQFDDIDYPNLLTMTTDLTPSGVQVNRGYATAGGIDVLNLTIGGAATNPAHGWRPLLVLVL